MVVACLALAVALSGTGYAVTALPKNSVGTAQLKKNAVTSVKVKNGSLLAADFAKGQVAPGPPGPAGTAGAKGDKGDTGAQGPPGLSGLETVTFTSPPTSNYEASATAQCPAGKRAIAGGGVIGPNGSAIALTGSVPSSPNGWTIQSKELVATTLTRQHAVWVLCASVAP